MKNVAKFIMRNLNINREEHTDWRSDGEAEGYELWKRDLRAKTEASNLCFFPNCFSNSSNSCFTKFSDSISSLPFLLETRIRILIEVNFLQIMIETGKFRSVFVFLFCAFWYFLYTLEIVFLLEGENRRGYRLRTSTLVCEWISPFLSATSFQQKIELIWNYWITFGLTSALSHTSICIS